MAALKRRQMLGLGALLCAPGALLADGSGSFAGSPQQPLLISAASDRDDKQWVIGLRLNAAGGLDTLFKHSVPERAHHIAINAERGFYLVLARRPGTWMMLGDLAAGVLHTEIRVPANRHLFGHGVFAGSDVFYTSESDFEDMTGDSGRIVEWRVTGEGPAAGLERVREFPSYGVGPHEILLHPDGTTLIVANGGIRTYPTHDRDNLNVDTMQPSLAYIDRHSGELLEQHYMPDEFHQSGIRHLDVNTDGLVALGMQFEGEPFMDVPLVATHRRGEELRLLKASPELQPQMMQYVGALRFDSGGRFFAASCPKGNMITFWDAKAGTLLQSTRARDGCGVCAVQDGFVFSTASTSRVAHIDLATNTVTDYEVAADAARMLWDNHMSVLA
jgi:uncharacterized protein